jgi:hypothetical protein
MNVDVRLYHDMFRISPADVRYLGRKELQAYGLEGTDPYVEQASYAARAKELGISTQELLRRRNDAEVQCKKPGTDFGKCYWAMEIGISRQEYDRRDKSAQKLCASSQSRVDWVRCHSRVIETSEK